jgi:hypothetical protein
MLHIYTQNETNIRKAQHFADVSCCDVGEVGGADGPLLYWCSVHAVFVQVHHPTLVVTKLQLHCTQN